MRAVRDELAQEQGEISAYEYRNELTAGVPPNKKPHGRGGVQDEQDNHGAPQNPRVRPQSRGCAHLVEEGGESRRSAALGQWRAAEKREAVWADIWPDSSELWAHYPVEGTRTARRHQRKRYPKLEPEKSLESGRVDCTK